MPEDERSLGLIGETKVSLRPLLHDALTVIEVQHLTALDCVESSPYDNTPLSDFVDSRSGV